MIHWALRPHEPKPSPPFEKEIIGTYEGMGGKKPNQPCDVPKADGRAKDLVAHREFIILELKVFCRDNCDKILVGEPTQGKIYLP